MNILIPLLLGIIIGYILRERRKKIDTELLMSVSVLVLIFLMGVRTGNVKIDATKVLLYSIAIMISTIAGSLIFAKIFWREKS
ncbi:hypothetical protein PFDSM3638_04905 [Pyrococcus furiosus DSM 3638]|uniref:Transmembrane protein n=4 Tax=Pyrococcus furiosus TaxID=2261 RepID=Q8U273_PYRFU|nr:MULTISPECIES: membrane protein [Pyrococcus]AAL81100.1 putative transmembrane protein [Pyrococcus furiosus DSM 3638]AFN03771.1 transmembrane protein [Pyrococcus furiosus COM1]MDK2869829.1 hypothetical protein [Pyrococcus sp.]QEK78642.1 hypothetical protein PFDSM3638_04905 [Pyrococcus furiosus DSM 3638]